MTIPEPTTGAGLAEETRARVLRIADLSEADVEAWNALCDGHADYGSPLLRPGFAMMIAARRSDVRVALFEKNDRIVGVFAYHLRPGRFARAVGTPFADYSGPVLSRDAELSPVDILSLADLSAYRFAGIPDPWQVFDNYIDEDDETFVVDLSKVSADEHLEAQRAAHPKRFKNFRRLRSQVERQQGVLELIAGRPDEGTLGVLLGWKSAQLTDSGLLDVTRSGGAGDVLQTIAAQETSECWGYLIQLRLDGKIIAGHFGLRCQNTFHPWIAAYDPAQAAISPGNLLLRDALMEMELLGLKRYDLAGGHDHYKKYYANQSVRTVSGFVSAPSVSGWMQSFSRFTWSLFGAPGARLERRFDHIAASELRLNRRLVELFKAVRAGLFSGPRQIGHAPAKTERSS